MLNTKSYYIAAKSHKPYCIVTKSYEPYCIVTKFYKPYYIVAKSYKLYCIAAEFYRIATKLFSQIKQPLSNFYNQIFLYTILCQRLQCRLPKYSFTLI